MSGGSYSSSSDPRVHFGLGSATEVDKIEIHWPSGTRQKATVPGVDRIVIIEEGKITAERIYGDRPPSRRDSSSAPSTGSRLAPRGSYFANALRRMSQTSSEKSGIPHSGNSGTAGDSQKS